MRKLPGKTLVHFPKQPGMIVLNFEETKLGQLITHHIGNKAKNESLGLSLKKTDFELESVSHLLKYFFTSFKPFEFFKFSDLESEKTIYQIAKEIFEDPNAFILQSRKIAKALFDATKHPKIKKGDLSVALLSDIQLGDEMVDAIGIFKSETTVPFLKLDRQDVNYYVNHDTGMDLKGLDKGCLIFNSNAEEGYEILVFDNTNGSRQAEFWKHDFLKIKAHSNEFHQTKEFLTLTEAFVKGQYSEEFEAENTEKIDLLNRSINYFKEHESFNKEDFVSDVFQYEDVIDSFNKFENDYQKDRHLNLSDAFEISIPAVKKQSRLFKSVLKLDKNFHVYIHGDKEKIVKGTEEDGRKFYKLYYEMVE